MNETYLLRPPLCSPRIVILRNICQNEWLQNVQDEKGGDYFPHPYNLRSSTLSFVSNGSWPRHGMLMKWKSTCSTDTTRPYTYRPREWMNETDHLLHPSRTMIALGTNFQMNYWRSQRWKQRMREDRGFCHPLFSVMWFAILRASKYVIGNRN